MANNAMSPLLSNVAEALHGRAVGRAMGVQKFFQDRHDKCADGYSRMKYGSETLLTWGPMQSQFLSFAVSLSAMVAVVAAAASGQMEDPGRVAMALAPVIVPRNT